MPSRISSHFEQLDHHTCRSICDAVGERLQQNLQPDYSPSSRLEHLMDELRRHDDDDRDEAPRHRH